jgi:hypothetical protein
MGTKFNDTCLDKAAEDEPIFVLRAQDYTTPKLVMLWIAENINNGKTPDDKLREAFEHALKMRRWSDRKSPD